ncbi:MAG: SRPBCC family protein [Anaerolineae bacterium]|nr:SRPBCC family protein [Anaerolineae bacterium]
MIQISNSIEIVLPVTQVFEFVADVENNPRWMPVQSVQRLGNGPMGVGTQFKQQFVLMDTRYNLDGVITGFEPHKQISFSYVAPIFTWRGAYIFEITPAGTRMSARGNVNLTGLLKMMEINFAPKIRRLINDTSPKLKMILES